MATKTAKAQPDEPTLRESLRLLQGERAIPFEMLLEALESALISAYKRNFGGEANAIVSMDRDTGEYKVYHRRLVVDDVTDLAGGTPGDLASAALAAKGRGAEGKWALALQNTTQQPAQAWLAKRATRERLWRASLGRCEKGDDNDTRALVQRLAELRAEKAKLLGFPTYAAYALSDQMARTPAAAVELLARVAAPALAKAREEAARMQALVDEGGGERFELAPWDWQFMAEAIRKKEYAVDDEEVRPYLELGRVLRDGAFFAADSPR